MLTYLRADDEGGLEAGRLCRNSRNLLALIADLEQRGPPCSSVTEGISTPGTMGRAMLTVVSAFDQFERDHGPRRKLGGRTIGVVRTRRLTPPPMVKNVLSPALTHLDSGNEF